jgi:hypothetical protein
MELPIIEPAPVVTEHAAVFRNLFENQCQFRHFQHYLTGLIVLTGKTVDGVLKELIAFALTYNLVRLVMGQAARRQHVDIDRISFIDAARWLAAARDDASLPTLVVNPHRPYRDEPRVRKRRPKQYPLMKNARQELRKSLATHTETD